MPRFLAALAVSAALATGSIATVTATPANANSIDPGAVAVGAITLGLIAAVAADKYRDRKDDRDDDRNQQYYSYKPRYQDAHKHKEGHKEGHQHKGRHKDAHKNDHKSPSRNVYKVNPAPQAYMATRPYRGWGFEGNGGGWSNRTSLPAQCLRDVSKPGEQRVLFGQNCLSQSRVPVGTLPSVCKVIVRTAQGPYTGFAPTCLRDRGYRVGQR